MFRLRTSIDINASPDVVWTILTNIDAFPDWNPFVHELRGELVVGHKISVTLGAPGKAKMKFVPTVLKVDANKELRWRGKLLIRGLFDGEHVFELQPNGTGTRFVHAENFGGLLVPLLKSKLERDIRPGFEAMNEALKERAEAMSAIAVG